MNLLKAGLIVLVCLILFWLGLRMARRMIDLTIAAGYASERRRQEEEAGKDDAPR